MQRLIGKDSKAEAQPALNMTEFTDRVEQDPLLNVAEKETTINIAGDKKEYRITSAKKTVVKSLLEHDHFDLNWARGIDRGGGEGRFFNLEQIEEEADEIYAVCGTMPVGCLTVKSKPRSNNNISGVVNSEKVDPEAFE